MLHLFFWVIGLMLVLTAGYWLWQVLPLPPIVKTIGAIIIFAFLGFALMHGDIPVPSF